MRLDLDQKILQLDGTPITDEEYRPDVDGKPQKILKEWTLKSIATQALLGVYDDERSMTGDEKFKRFKLASAIHDGIDDLSSEDITLLKKVIAKAYSPLVVGRAFEMIEAIGYVEPAKSNGKSVGQTPPMPPRTVTGKRFPNM